MWEHTAENKYMYTTNAPVIVKSQGWHGKCGLSESPLTSFMALSEYSP